MKTTLLIMAAGIGSRFGTGIKQLEPVDASNHIIMDYSIHDAIEAGFNQVVTLEAKKAKADVKAAEEAKKAEAESVLKKLLASGMSADEILEKLK